MLIQTTNLLQRVRVITIALVAIIGFGTMAMKPAAATFAHTYGVAETAGGLNWEIRADVTGLPPFGYNCDFAPHNPACLILSDSNYSAGQQIPINSETVEGRGNFSLN